MAVRFMKTTGDLRVRGYSYDGITARCGDTSQNVVVQIVADSHRVTVQCLEAGCEASTTFR